MPVIVFFFRSEDLMLFYLNIECIGHTYLVVKAVSQVCACNEHNTIKWFLWKIKCFLKYDLHSCTHTFRASTQHGLLNSSHRNREWMFAFSATILLLSTIHMQNCSLHCNDSSCVFASIARADIRGTVWYSLRRVECRNLFHGGKTAI